MIAHLLTCAVALAGETRSETGIERDVTETGSDGNSAVAAALALVLALGTERGTAAGRGGKTRAWKGKNATRRDRRARNGGREVWKKKKKRQSRWRARLELPRRNRKKLARSGSVREKRETTHAARLTARASVSTSDMRPQQARTLTEPEPCLAEE